MPENKDKSHVNCLCETKLKEETGRILPSWYLIVEYINKIVFLEVM